eukprot:scaffold293151_cov24-Tisochrysis_lutea.AAC.1
MQACLRQDRGSGAGPSEHTLSGGNRIALYGLLTFFTLFVYIFIGGGIDRAPRWFIAVSVSMGGCDAARQKGGAVSNVCHACSANECTYPGSAQHAPAVPKSLIIDMSCTFPAAAAPCKAAASFPWHARGKGQPCPCVQA